MFNQIQNGALKSGNAVKLDEPVHMDKSGNAVADEKDGLGLPVSIKITRPENCFVLDETGSNTHGKDDARKGGEKKVVPKGEVPRELVGVHDSHFSVLPITNYLGELVFVTVIFAAEKLNNAWTFGVDVFAELEGNEDDFDSTGDACCNFGTGKRFPGLSLPDAEGNDVPTLFAATPNASMTTAILKKTFAAMDELNITSCGVNEDGTLYFPLVVIDGHASRMGEAFLEYVNDESHRWLAMLGAPYGTDIWQFHDDKRQNGCFKTELSDAKSRFTLKKRVHGLKAEILPVEIVIPLREAIMNSFMRTDFGKSALAVRGCYPFN